MEVMVVCLLLICKTIQELNESLNKSNALKSMNWDSNGINRKTRFSK